MTKYERFLATGFEALSLNEKVNCINYRSLNGKDYKKCRTESGRALYCIPLRTFEQLEYKGYVKNY